MGWLDPLANAANKAIGKIPSENDRNEAAKKILEAGKEQEY